jgi:formiminotetrahydrofolate cyclodeaminase
MTVDEFLEALGARTPAPASGAAAALTGAMAAALAELAARFAGDDAAVEEARRLRARLVALADEDAEAYAAFMETKSDEARARIVEVPLAIAETADAVEALAVRIERVLTTAVVGDARASRDLAVAGGSVARALAELNRR